MKRLLENFDLLAYHINFNYKSKKVYNSFFSVYLSLCLYALMIVFIQYFSKDFINKTNPKVIYQETEFVEENITIPINFILKSYEYMFTFESKENYYNLTPDKNFTEIFNQDNNFFYFEFFLADGRSISYLNLTDKMDILVLRQYENGNEIFSYEVKSNLKDPKFLNISSQFYNIIDSNNSKIVQNNISYDDYNISINSKLSIKFSLKSKIEAKLVYFYNYVEIFHNDSIINVNGENFFKSYIDYKSVNFIDNFKCAENINFNYGIVKLIDDSGLIFSEKTNFYSLKKNYENYNRNPLDNNPIFIMEFSRVMKQYERNFRKLQNVFADLGGLLNSLIIIGNVIISQINKKKFSYDLINHIFHIDNANSNFENNFNIFQNNLNLISNKTKDNNIPANEEIPRKIELKKMNFSVKEDFSKVCVNFPDKLYQEKICKSKQINDKNSFISNTELIRNFPNLNDINQILCNNKIKDENIKMNNSYTYSKRNIELEDIKLKD